MMHYWFVAGVVITSAVVVYTAYTLYKEAEGQAYYVFEGDNDRRSHNNNQQRSHRDTEEDDVPLNNYKEKSNLLRRRKKKSKNSNSQRSENSPVHSENEEELLDKLSYLNAVEQEIERKKQQLADEERILNEKEREIERRKQNLISSSHSSLSWHSLDSPTGINLPNSNNSTPTTVGSINVNEPSPLIIPSPNDLNSPPTDLSPIAPVVTTITTTTTAPSIKTMTSSLHDEQQRDNENHGYSDDMAAHSILTQDLSHISQNQKTSSSNNYPSVIMKPSSRSVTTNSTISSSQKHLQDDDDYDITKSQLLMRPNIINDSNQSRFMTTTKSIRSEDTWSEIDSVISENIGSILSSAVDIDMEDVDVIEH